jgi:hypothetical protein
VVRRGDVKRLQRWRGLDVMCVFAHGALRSAGGTRSWPPVVCTWQPFSRNATPRLRLQSMLTSATPMPLPVAAAIRSHEAA